MLSDMGKDDHWERTTIGRGRPLGEVIYEEIYSLYAVLDKDGLRTGAGGGASMSVDDVYYILVDTPIGRIPLIGATMTDEREREIEKKYSVKEKSRL